MLGIVHSVARQLRPPPRRLLALLPSNGVNFSPVASNRRHYGGRESREPRTKWFLVFPAICFGLGTWQVYRRRWKLNLIESLKRRIQQPVIVVPPGGSVATQLLPKLAELEYRPVTITGEFDYSAEVLIGPRHLIEEGGADSGGGGGTGSLFSSGANVGYHLVTPLRLADSADGERVLVNRGWVPARFADPASRAHSQTPGGRVTVTGLLRLSEPASVFGKGGELATTGGRGGGARVTCRLRRDVERLSEELNTLPVFIDANRLPTDKVGSGDQPIGGQTRLSIRNEHLSYIVTWYSLGALLTALWAFRVR